MSMLVNPFRFTVEPGYLLLLDSLDELAPEEVILTEDEDQIELE